MKYLIYLSKEDVWGNAPTNMSSASRDIFDDFYDSIYGTFLNQFNSPEQKDLMEKIQGVRNWYLESIVDIDNTAEGKQDDLQKIPKYIENKIAITQTQGNDTNIYPDFETFFQKAEHGYYKNDEARETVLELYNFFIQDFSTKNLQDVLNQETAYYTLSIKKQLNTLKDYVKAGRPGRWFDFMYS